MKYFIITKTLIAFTILHLQPFVANCQTMEFPNQIGWTWLFKPIRLPQNIASVQGNIISCYELKNDDLLINFACAVKENDNQYSLNAVAFDSIGNRYDITFHNGAGSNEILMKTFILSSAILPIEHVKYIGFEELSQDSLKYRVSPSALSQLLSLGQQALPYPEINQPYDFDIITIDRDKLSSKNLRGKVILLDFWASWCSPCMAKMGDLKELYQRHKQNGLVIIGINYDNSVETAKKYIIRENLSWPNVLAPIKKEFRDLWDLSCGVTTLPRLLIIDRKGVLRADIQPHDLEKVIETIMKE